MPPESNIAAKSGLTLYRPSLRATLILAPTVAAALGVALFLRYGIIQNTPIGLACEAGEDSFTCTVRFAAILLFTWDVFGWVAAAAALVQLWRPNTIAFCVGSVFAALGLVLYNTRLSALAVALLVISLARAAPKAR
jgi:Gpi18-like mannosyltransferase